MNRKTFLLGLSATGLIPFAHGINLFETSESGKNLPKMIGPELKNSYWYIGHLMSILISSQDTSGSFSLIHGYEIKGLEPYYFIAPNLYVVATPKDANGADTMIEDFFDQNVRDEKNHGKTFNPKEPVNVKTEYGKFIFAEQIVKKNQNRINFSGFKPILDRIDTVLIDFQQKLSVNIP